MNHQTSLLTLHQPAETAVTWTSHQLMARGFQVERTFDLHAARMLQVDCPCPYHGTEECNCQMIVLLVRNQRTQPVTIVLHGHDGQTSLSLVDMAGQSINKSIVQALLPVMENFEF